MIGGHPASGAEPLPCVLTKLGRLLERRMQRVVSEYGVSANQFIALVHIGRNPGISRADLARGLQVTPQAIGGLTAQLVQKGLIARTTAQPGLPLEYTLTDAGADVLDNAAPAVQLLTREMLRWLRTDLAMAMDGAHRHLLSKLSQETRPQTG
jgi:DNA-binding MarR family transcriptional regulator